MAEEAELDALFEDESDHEQPPAVTEAPATAPEGVKHALAGLDELFDDDDDAAYLNEDDRGSDGEGDDLYRHMGANVTIPSGSLAGDMETASFSSGRMGRVEQHLAPEIEAFLEASPAVGASPGSRQVPPMDLLAGTGGDSRGEAEEEEHDDADHRVERLRAELESLHPGEFRNMSSLHRKQNAHLPSALYFIRSILCEGDCKRALSPARTAAQGVAHFAGRRRLGPLRTQGAGTS